MKEVDTCPHCGEKLETTAFCFDGNLVVMGNSTGTITVPLREMEKFMAGIKEAKKEELQPA